MQVNIPTLRHIEQRFFYVKIKRFYKNITLLWYTMYFLKGIIANVVLVFKKTLLPMESAKSRLLTNNPPRPLTNKYD